MANLSELTVTTGITMREKPLAIAQETNRYQVFQGDCLEVLSHLEPDTVDLVFADPPYNLSNDGFTCQSGRAVSVNKGDWDKSQGIELDFEFHKTWMAACKRVLKPGGSLWVSGTYHNIYACGFALQVLDFHWLNDICWYKPNASPNLSCRFFTASHETLLWARKSHKGKHTFNYKAMKFGQFPKDVLKKESKQMRSVWMIPTPPVSEKRHGTHPTQKPLSLLNRVVAASTNPGDVVIDPFMGSGTTGVAAIAQGRQFIGIEQDAEFCELAIARLKETASPPAET